MALIIRSNNEKENNKFIYELNGDLDINTAEKLRERYQAEKSNFQDLVLDFENVDFIDSTGIGVVVNIYKEVSLNGDFKIINANQHILKLFKITGLLKVFVK